MIVCIVATHGGSLINFRGKLIQELVKRNHQVVCISIEPEKDMHDRIRALGASYYQVGGTRTGINILEELKMIATYKRAFNEIKPDICLFYMSKPVAYGGIAAIQCGIQNINILINGLENAFYRTGLKDAIVRKAMCFFYKKVARKSNNVFFQNQDDYAFFLRKNLADVSKSTVLNGSGVDMMHFKKEPLPEKLAVLMIARLLWSKGIREYLESVKIIKKERPDVRAMLVGGLDNNDEALTKEELDSFIAQNDIEYYGHLDDVRPILKQCSIFILPSYHEGTPRSVLEAMATGRPIITTDAPGCRETVVEGENGYLVSVGDSTLLAKKALELLNNTIQLNAMAERSYEICREKYEVGIVNQIMIDRMFRDKG